MTRGEIIEILLSITLGVVIGFLLRGSIVRHTEHESVRIDTLTHVIERAPVIVRNAPARVDTVTQWDTLIVTPPFVARLDTVVLRDTVQVQYAFPQHTFSVAIRSNPDTVRVPQLTITQYEQRPWWIDALTHVGAASVGYAIGSAR